MKLAYRYLFGNFIRPWAYVFAGFCIVAILVDLFGTFGDFVETGAGTGNVLAYYFVLLPTFFPYIFPISVLLALLYALWSLGKNSEIVALRACGFSLWQIASPFVAVGLVASFLLLAINELFNPAASYWTRQFREAQGEEGGGYVARNLTHKNVAGHRLWTTASFDVRPEEGYAMEGVDLFQQRPDGSDEYRLHAARAKWMENGYWWFGGATIRYYDASNNPTGPAESASYFDTAEITEKPKDFIEEIKDPDNGELSARDIWRFLATHDVSEDARTRRMVDFHSRLAAPWMCLIAVLLGIPFGMRTARRGMGLGIVMALLTFFGYYVFMAMGLAFGKDRSIYRWIEATFSDPAPALEALAFLAGWFPAIFFLVLAVVMLRRQE